MLEVDHDIIEFRIRLNIFCLLTNKDIIKSKTNSFSLNSESKIITPCRNIDKVDRYVTPYVNIFDNAVSNTEFYLSLNSYFQKMKNGNLDHNFNDHEINKTKMNKICLHLQKKHKFNQNNYLSIIKQCSFKRRMGIEIYCF